MGIFDLQPRQAAPPPIEQGQSIDPLSAPPEDAAMPEQLSPWEGEVGEQSIMPTEDQSVIPDLPPTRPEGLPDETGDYPYQSVSPGAQSAEQVEPDTSGNWMSAAPKRLHAIIDEASSTHNVPQNLISAVMAVESGFDPSKVNERTGATGLMQLKEGAASDEAKRQNIKGFDRKNAWHNTMGGTGYLGLMLRRSNGNIDEALARYHMGSHGFDTKPMGPNTRKYVKMVRAKLDAMGAQKSKLSGEAEKRGGAMGRFSLGGPGANTGLQGEANYIDKSISERQRLLGEQHTIAMTEGLTRELGLKNLSTKRGQWNKRIKDKMEKDKLDLSMYLATTVAPEIGREHQLAEEIKATDIKSDRYWSSASTGKKVLTIISLALGAFTEGFTGGKVKNAALKMLDTAISRDIALQKANLLNKRGALADQKGVVARLYRQHGNMEKATLLATDQLYRLAKEDLQAQIEKTNSSLAKINGMKQFQELSIRHRAAVEKLKGTEFQQDATDRSFQIKQMALAAKTAKQKGGVRPPDKVLAKYEAAAGGIKQIDLALAAIKKNGYGWAKRHFPNTHARQILDLYLRPISVSQRKAAGETGVMTENDYKRYEKMLVSPFMSEGELVKRLNIIRSEIAQKANVGLGYWGMYYNVSPIKARLSAAVKGVR